MTDSSVTEDGLRVTTCDTEGTLAPAADLFDRYRQHYGRPPAENGRTLDWLSEMVRSQLLTVHTVARPAVPGTTPRPIGLATTHAVPASLAMGRFWLLRDLFVVPDERRRGIAAVLVGAVQDAARKAGTMRLSLTTEIDNHAALRLYRGLGFQPVHGLTTLNLDLRETPEI